MASSARKDNAPESDLSSVAGGTVGGNPSLVAEEIAEDMAVAMFDGHVGKPVTEIPAEGAAQPVIPFGEQDAAASLQEHNTSLRAQCEQLQNELDSARNEIAFAQLKGEEFENRHNLAQETITDLKRQTVELGSQVSEKDAELSQARADLELHSSENRSAADSAVTAARAATADARRELDEAADSKRAQESEIAGLRLRLSVLERELVEAQQREVLHPSSIEPPTAQPTMELPQDSSMEAPLLTASYQQISVLNTQLAHLYTELTIARTEAQQLRGEASGSQEKSQLDNFGSASTAEVQKQNQQIADLVSDIRHLQLDLEYHQQKLDQMIEDKQKMMKDLKKCQQDLAEAKQQIDEKDQMLKHRDVDIAHLKQELRNPGGAGGGSGNGSVEDPALNALRAEAVAKDSALIVSHYELHKEKLMRDRLEQKNLKLMERMQKLMMVVETMRKESVAVERTLAGKDRTLDEKELQLRTMTQKARQLQKIVKTSKGGAGGVGSQRSLSNKNAYTSLELEAASGLPPLQQQRSVDSGGARSGASTPRSARGAPSSPYRTG